MTSQDALRAGFALVAGCFAVRIPRRRKPAPSATGQCADDPVSLLSASRRGDRDAWRVAVWAIAIEVGLLLLAAAVPGISARITVGWSLRAALIAAALVCLTGCAASLAGDRLRRRVAAPTGDPP